MTRLTTIIIFLGLAGSAYAGEIKGTVKDQNGEALPGVNVYIKDTYDGATTNLDGQFSFSTTEEGEQTLIASFVGYLSFESTVDLQNPIALDIQLKEEVNRLSGVTITAGTFEASDEKKAVVLKPLDIAMTAGATADIPGALNALPGTTKNGETGRLFVRGGTANETQAFIDGIKVHNFYMATPQNVPSRSRFSPFLFKGTFFSTGGYSAEYGQALSSVLSLNSVDIPDETKTDLSFMTAGLGAAHTQKWDNGSIYGDFYYMNLGPYNNLIDQEIDWKEGYQSMNGTIMLRQKTNSTDMLKVYANYDHSSFRAIMPNVNFADGVDIDLVNNNFYLNTSYRKAVGEHSAAFFGASIGNTQEDILYDTTAVDSDTKGYHAKAHFSTDIAQVSVKVGGEIIHSAEEEDAIMDSGNQFHSEFDNNQIAGFVEADYFISNNLTLRAGLRYSNYSIFDENVFSPRVSMAYKTGENSQISWAYGKFHQLPQNDLMLRSQQMSFEEADHYMISYQSIKNGKTFRGEIYYKDYQNLVKFDAQNPFNPTGYNNAGSGYARGIDLFFRDSETINNVDYWISYSYIDTKRDHRNYPGLARPEFAAGHNFSFVYKHFIPDIKTQIGATYSFNSGRPYNNPNEDVFNNGMTKSYHDLSFNMAYLWKQNVIVYASVTNVLGIDQVFGYDYEVNPGEDGIHDRMAVTPPAPRFYFVGLFITLTKDKQANNLENL